MRSLLNALHDGRLVELPDTDKNKSLQFIAHLIEAVPEIGGGLELAEEVIQRESVNNTGIGSGVACPHVRAQGGGDLICAVGWSPTGIDYGSKDGKKVHLMIMYYVPDSEKNTYLKEISGLVRAVREQGDIEALAKAQDIATVRDELLNWVSSTLDARIPETKARMIRLEARQAALSIAEEPETAAAPLSTLQIFPLLFIALPDEKQLVLSEMKELTGQLEGDATIGVLLKQHATFDRFGYRFFYRDTITYDLARPLYEYFAVKLP
jgi:nitrogen PTS system EIIA component